jgi:hypothetical protein
MNLFYTMKIEIIFISARAESNNKEKLLDLAVNWDCLDGAQDIFNSDRVF